MENRLRIRYEKNINKYVDVIARHFIAVNVDMKEEELFEDLKKFNKGNNKYVAFVYDDECGGEIIMQFGEDKESAFIEVSSDYTYDVLTMQEIIEPLINRIEV